jgi:hypothetical protein
MAMRTNYVALRLLILLGFGLMLGACSKCDIPTPWEHIIHQPGSCHGGPEPQ